MGRWLDSWILEVFPNLPDSMVLLPRSFLEQLHKHQGAVLHPDYKSSFRSFDDAVQRLLPYHVYQGVLPSAHDYRKGTALPGHAAPRPRGRGGPA